MRPTVDGSFICQVELEIGALEILEKAGAVNRYGCLACHGGQKIQPFIIWLQHGTMIDLQNSFDLSFCDQWHPIITGEFLKMDPLGKKHIGRLSLEVSNTDGTAFESSLSCVTLPDQQG